MLNPRFTVECNGRFSTFHWSSAVGAARAVAPAAHATEISWSGPTGQRGNETTVTIKGVDYRVTQISH